MTSDSTDNIVFEGGPKDDQTDTIDRSAVVIGDGAEGGVYQRTDEVRHGLTVYRWQLLTEAEAAALAKGDPRANQQP